MFYPLAGLRQGREAEENRCLFYQRGMNLSRRPARRQESLKDTLKYIKETELYKRKELAR
jgi:hypothetical protein